MAVDREQSPQKLIYLRDHTARSRTRSLRHERRPPPSSPPELAGEAIWLGRVLLGVSAVTLAYWLAVMSGAAVQEGEEWRWTLSHSLAHLFLAASAALAGRLLLRNAPRAPLFVAVAAGGLVVTALEGLTRAVIASSFSDISLGGRSDILTKAIVLAAGIWSCSYALRADRRPE